LKEILKKCCASRPNSLSARSERRQCLSKKQFLGL
jgi:hypothetical protein